MGLTRSIIPPEPSQHTIFLIWSPRGIYNIASSPYGSTVWFLNGGVYAVDSTATSAFILLFAQVANGILLPVIAVYLLVVMNSRRIMGDNVNTLLSNILGGIVVLTAMGLGIRSILHVIGII